MKKLIFLALLIIALLISPLVFAADVKLDWDASSGATGYRVEMSTDMGVTWQAPILATSKPFTYPGVPEDKLILFRVSSFNAVAEATNKYAGCWYDHRQKLGVPIAMRGD